MKLLNGWRTPAAATLTGFLGPGLDAGRIIARTDSYQSICIGSLQPYLCRHAVVQSALSNRDCSLLTHAPLFMVHRRGYSHGVLYNSILYRSPWYSYVNDSASIAPVSIYERLRRGCVGSYQLSVFGFQIVAVFGRIRIVHLAHYSVRFEFELNIRYSPKKYDWYVEVYCVTVLHCLIVSCVMCLLLLMYSSSCMPALCLQLNELIRLMYSFHCYLQKDVGILSVLLRMPGWKYLYTFCYIL